MVLFLYCFGYPSEDQEMYDEECQVQRVHVNSNAEESSQYQPTHKIAKSPQVQVNNWTDPLRLKNEENQRKIKMMT